MPSPLTDQDELRPGPARFDAGLGAWLLSRYADVSTALREPALVPPGDGTEPAPDAAGAGFDVTAPERQADLRERLESSALERATALPVATPVDLARDFAEPWSRALAVWVTGAGSGDADRLIGLAGAVFLAAARSTDGEPGPAALAASAELARGLPGAGAGLSVQAFVALTHTLPGFLSAAWGALFRHPDEARRLRARPELLPRAVEELLRYAGPARAVFRRARRPVTIGQAVITPGRRVILGLAAANRDPARFPEPDRLDLDRGAAGHLGFGWGPHACAGAQLIRLAAAATTAALLRTTSRVELTDGVEWRGGFAIRVPACLPAVLWREAGPGG